MTDVCFVLNDDSKEWPDYIMSLFKDPSRISMGTELDSKLASGKSRSIKLQAKMTVVILSHGHLSLLCEKNDLNYKTLVPDPDKAVLFMLGVQKDDLNSLGPMKLQNFSKWKQFNHDQTNEMVKYIEKRLKSGMPPPQPLVQKNFKLVPDTARSEDPTTITIFFDEPVTQTSGQVKVEALLSDETSGGLTIVVPTQRENPYSYTFVAPEHREGESNVRILMDGRLVGTKPLKYTSNVEKYNALSQIYIHQLSKLCNLLTKNRVGITEVDTCLSTLFDPESSTDIPVEAFELMFGIYRFASTENSDAELPTLLHFAARHGLQELTSKLTDLPDATLANSIVNKDNKMPEDLAKINKHGSLTTFLENFREVNEGFEDLYVKCHGYVNADGPGKADLGGYLKAKNRLLELNTAADYIVLYPSDRGEADEDGDDEIYYMYTPAGATTAKAGGSETSSAFSPAPLPTKRASSSSLAAATTPAKGPTMSGDQQQLVEIMDLYKNSKCSIGEVEVLFKQWKLQYQDSSSSKSFRDKQEKLRKMKEDVAKARKQGDWSQSDTQPKSQKRPDEGAPALPPRGR